MSSTEVWNDCCEFCLKNDPSPTQEIDPCVEMCKRCKGDSCSTCKPCKDFVKGAEFQTAYTILQRKATKVRFLKTPQTPPSPEEADIDAT